MIAFFKKIFFNNNNNNINNINNINNNNLNFNRIGLFYYFKNTIFILLGVLSLFRVYYVSTYNPEYLNFYYYLLTLGAIIALVAAFYFKQN
jgi:hypothetical protein